MLDTQRAARAPGELIDGAALVADLKALAASHARQRARTARRRRAPPQIGAERGPRTCRATAAQGPPRAALRRAAVPDAGRDHPHPVRIRVVSELYPPQVPSQAERMAVIATGGYGRGLLGAGLRHRSPVPAPLQADRLGRNGRRSAALLSVGHGAEGRPRHAFGQRMHPPGQGGHDHPHRAPGIALSVRRRQALRRIDRALRQGGRAGHGRRSSSPPSSPSARSATAAPANRAIWSSPTSRTARAACAICTRCSGSPNTSIACASRRN